MPIYIHQIPTGRWKENCYIIYDEVKDCIIIDPGSDEKTIIGYIQNKKLNVHAILNTHAHYDHVGAVNALKTVFKSPFYLHSKDKGMLKHINLYRKFFDGDGALPVPDVDVFVDKIKNPIKFGNLKIDVIFTPGHTPGGVSYMLENHLFCGDTLLKRKIGRTDLPGVNKKDFFRSLKQLSELPIDTMIHPGHGQITTLKDEMKNNQQFLEVIK